MERRLPQFFFALEPDRAGSDAGRRLAGRHARLEEPTSGSSTGWRRQGNPTPPPRAAVLNDAAGDPPGPAAGLAARRPLHHLPPGDRRPHHEERAAAVHAITPTWRRMFRRSSDAPFCHGGQGLATDKQNAHGNVAFWQEPLLPKELHPRLLRALPQGRRRPRRAGTDRRPPAVRTHGCRGCHKLNGVGGTIGPDLTEEGAVRRSPNGWNAIS